MLMSGSWELDVLEEEDFMQLAMRVRLTAAFFRYSLNRISPIILAWCQRNLLSGSLRLGKPLHSLLARLIN
jgi:hypothetical protein